MAGMPVPERLAGRRRHRLPVPLSLRLPDSPTPTSRGDEKRPSDEEPLKECMILLTRIDGLYTMTKVKNVREKRIEAVNCAPAPKNRVMYGVVLCPCSVSCVVRLMPLPPGRDVPHSSSAMRGNRI